MPSLIEALRPDAPPKAALLVAARFLAMAAACAFLMPMAEPGCPSAPPAAASLGQALIATAGEADTRISDEEEPIVLGPLSRSARKLAALARDPRARFTVLHIGDSHVQYGEFPGAARQVLQAAYGDAGRGFVYPYELTGTEGPLDTRFSAAGRSQAAAWESSRIVERRPKPAPGMSGYALALHGGAAVLDFSFIRSGSGRKAGLVRVFSRPGAGWSLRLEDPSDPNNEALPLALEGSAFAFPTPVGRLRLRIERGPKADDGFILDGLSLESGSGGVLYHAIGVNSATWKAFSAPGVIEAMAALRPDLVVLSLGTNESVNDAMNAARIRADALAVLGRVRSAMPASDILVTGPGANCRRGLEGQWRPNRLVAELNEGTMAAAKEAGAAFLDWLAEMGGPQAMESWVRRGLAASDRIHLSPSGYALEGRFLARAILALEGGGK